MLWTISNGQTNYVFEVSKGTWNFPIKTVISIDTREAGCLGGRSNSFMLTLKAECAQEVRAIQAGEIADVTEIAGVKMVMLRAGNYFLFTTLLRKLKQKGDKVVQGNIIGTLAKGDDGKTFDLMLMLFNQGKQININSWFDWHTAHYINLLQ